MQLGLTPNPCNLCPRRCGVDRRTSRGFCGAPADPVVPSVTIHLGEEPPLSGARGPHAGIVNLFFAHCNLHCIFCQNHQISGPTLHSCSPSQGELSEGLRGGSTPISSLADRIAELLPASNGLLGLVTAAHYAHTIPPLLDDLHARGLNPVVVYNSSGYESLDTLRALEGLVDIYLPDLKYLDPDLAARYSHAPDYPQVATQALLEMKRQVGSSLKCDPDGIAFRGIIVRHLVLPGHLQNTIDCLDWLADNFPPTLHLSLMSQYFPPLQGLPTPIDRTLTADEYAIVSRRFEQLGFNGWLQEPDANTNYRPDFDNNTSPFK